MYTEPKHKTFAEALQEPCKPAVNEFSREFISTLEHKAITTLDDWLRANHAPEEVVEFLGDVIDLVRYTDRLYHDAPLEEHEVENLLAVLPSMTSRIMELGGVFEDKAGVTPRRENVITWKAGE